MVERIKRKLRNLDKTIHRKKIIELEKEIFVAVIFATISAVYISSRYGSERLVDTLFLWLFPASVTIVLTLIFILLLEILHEKH